MGRLSCIKQPTSAHTLLCISSQTISCWLRCWQVETTRYVLKVEINRFVFSVSVQIGLKGCGISTATSLARGGYGTTLMDGISCDQSTMDVTAFLAIWRKTLIHELQTNKSGFLHKCLPALAASVPLDFPNLKLINLYLNPVTSEHERPKENITTITEQGPDLVGLAQFIEEHFVWGDLTGILKRYSTCVFPGLALRELLSAARDTDRGMQPKPLSMIGKTHGQRQPSKASSHRALEIRTSLLVTRRTIDAVCDGLAGKRNTPMTSTIVGKWIENTLPQLRVWVPVVVHSFVLPSQVSSVVEDEPGMFQTIVDSLAKC
jgi:holliday junction resolvase YEN1